MIWHDEANKILDMADRNDQISHYKSLPIKIRPAVGELVKIAKKAELNLCYPAWRRQRFES